MQRTITQLMEQGLNANLYWENNDLAHTVSLVPTSAHTGEGIPDLLRMLITLTQERLTVSPSLLSPSLLTLLSGVADVYGCFAMHSLGSEGRRWTWSHCGCRLGQWVSTMQSFCSQSLDLIPSLSTLREGDTIVVSTLEGPVVTPIRALLTPPPNREMRSYPFSLSFP
jgi:translation initiation factor 5B